MHLRPPLTLRACAAAGDGGSLAVDVIDSDGHKHWITLVQHVFLDGYAVDRIPGRLYWNDELIGIRSAEESTLLASLESPLVDCSTDLDPDAACDGHEADAQDRKLVLDEITEDVSRCAEAIRTFVSSDRYLEIAEKLHEE